MLDILIKVKGVDLYVDFLLKLIKGVEFCAGATDKDEKLRYTVDLIRETVAIMDTMDHMKGQIRSEYMTELRQELNEQLY